MATHAFSVLSPPIRVLGFVVLLLAGCGENRPIPIPDEFDASFVQGKVCVPNKAHTGSGTRDQSATCETDDDCPGTMACDASNDDGESICAEAAVPITFDTCLYRCVQIDQGSVRMRWYWSCSGGQCVLVPVVTAHLNKVKNEKDCDGRDLEDPPEGECFDEQFEFSISPPYGDEGYVEGAFTVSVPYLDMEAAEDVLGRLESGDSLSEAVAPEIENVRYPEREFPIEFAEGHPVVLEGADIAAGDCVEIPAP